MQHEVLQISRIIKMDILGDCPDLLFEATQDFSIMYRMTAYFLIKSSIRSVLFIFRKLKISLTANRLGTSNQPVGICFFHSVWTENTSQKEINVCHLCWIYGQLTDCRHNLEILSTLLGTTVCIKSKSTLLFIYLFFSRKLIRFTSHLIYIINKLLCSIFQL